ncbi:hypothetical protein BsWGS_10894 [Bradybaena similaris]
MDSIFYSTPETQRDSLIGESGMLIFNWIVWAVVSEVVVVFGIISNIINIICFVNQGFKDSINVSLTGLAIADLGCLLPLVWANISYTPAFTDLDFPFDVIEVQFMTSGTTHVVLSRISCWVTALITLERCLCVSMPLKVKNIATSKRTCIAIVSIFVVLTATGSTQFLYYRMGPKFYLERNKTLLGIIYTEDHVYYHKIAFPVNLVFVPNLAFVIVIVCTIKLVTQLKNKGKWRMASATTEEAARLTSANMKVAKMVVTISVLFICCFTPLSITSILISAVPGFSIDGKLGNFISVLAGIGFLLESVNSSVNIIIYYNMSSKYRDTFHQIIVKRKVQL